MKVIASVVQVAGLVLVASGAWFWSIEAGLMTTGLAGVLVGLALERR